jgi:GntR family transcriptional repressor for pyruvate dehydrogenase complex
MKSTAIKIQKVRLTDQIVRQLVSMIADGTFKPGEQLPSEPQLMKQFGVGRSSIREAVGALSLIGLLNVSHGRGTRVNAAADEALSKSLGWVILTMGRDKIHELIEARCQIEQTLVRLAAAKATREDIAEIRFYHERLKTAKIGSKKIIHADLAFHTALARASHNHILTSFISELRQPMRRWMEQKASVDWGYANVFEQHDVVFKAIEEHDPDKAQVAMREHLEITGQRLIEILIKKWG